MYSAAYLRPRPLVLDSQREPVVPIEKVSLSQQYAALHPELVNGDGKSATAAATVIDGEPAAAVSAAAAAESSSTATDAAMEVDTSAQAAEAVSQ